MKKLLVACLFIVTLIPNIGLAQTNNSLSDSTQRRLVNLSANISNRLEATADRLLDITRRLENRVAKTELTDTQKLQIQEKISATKLAINQSQGNLRNIDQLVYNAFSSEDPASEWSKVRLIYLDSKQSLRNAHAHLWTGINLFKDPGLSSNAEIVANSTEGTLATSTLEQSQATTSTSTETN